MVLSMATHSPEATGETPSVGFWELQGLSESAVLATHYGLLNLCPNPTPEPGHTNRRLCAPLGSIQVLPTLMPFGDPPMRYSVYDFHISFHQAPRDTHLAALL